MLANVAPGALVQTVIHSSSEEDTHLVGGGAHAYSWGANTNENQYKVRYCQISRCVFHSVYRRPLSHSTVGVDVFALAKIETYPLLGAHFERSS